MTSRPKDIPMLTLRARITIEVSAKDYVEAAKHQRRAEALFAVISAEYAGATFSFHHLRPKSTHDAEASTPARSRRYKTRPRLLATYHDG